MRTDYKRRSALVHRLRSQCRWLALYRSAFGRANKEAGEIDVLANDADITRNGGFREMSLDNWTAAIDTWLAFATGADIP